MRAWLNYNELPRTKGLSSLWHGTLRKPFACLLMSWSVFMRTESFSWVKWTKTGFCLMLIFCSFIQDGLRCDWGIERGAWYLKCSMVIPLFSSLYSLSPLPTLVSISFHPDYSGCYWKISTRKAKCSTSRRQRKLVQQDQFCDVQIALRIFLGQMKISCNCFTSDQQAFDKSQRQVSNWNGHQVCAWV